MKRKVTQKQEIVSIVNPTVRPLQKVEIAPEGIKRATVSNKYLYIGCHIMVIIIIKKKSRLDIPNVTVSLFS